MVGSDITEVQTMHDRLLRVFSSFKEACEKYSDTLLDDIDVEESIVYVHEAESRYLAAKDRIAVWLQSRKDSSLEEKDMVDVDAQDSVSQTDSRSSHRSSSSRHSKFSIKAQHFKNAAKLASLRAEASLLKQRQSIANEELRISQMKQKLELETQMVKLEAEERICAEFGTSVNAVCHDKPYETVQTINVSSIPLRDIQITDQEERELPPNIQSVTPSEPARPTVMFEPPFEGRVVRSTHQEPVKTGESQCKAFNDVNVTPASPQKTHLSLDPLDSSGESPAQYENARDVMQTMNLSPLAPPWQPNMQSVSKRSKSEGDSSNAEDNGAMYLETMRNLATATLLPRSELMVFDGNPIQYSLFIRSFENSLEIGTSDFSKRLQLLIQFCSGKARKAIENCILLEPKEGYLKARQLLNDRFGGAYKVSNKWLAKVSEGNQIRPGDGEALQELADDLESCEITLKATGRMSQLNNEDRLVKIVQRCPAHVKSRWQARVQEIRMCERDPTIEDLRKLIRLAAREKTDPVFGGIMDSGNKDFSLKQRTPRSLEYSKGRVFSITTTEPVSSEKISTNLKCYFCNQNHRLENCKEFLQQNGEQQFTFIRFKKLCDNCLSPFHYSAGCKRRKACKIPGCSITRKHIGAIHDSVQAFEQRRNEQKNAVVVNTGKDGDEPARCSQVKSGEATSKSRVPKAVSQFNGLAYDTGAGSAGKGLPIVPVKVTCRSTNKVFTTYALLDSGSTASFCSNSLLEELEVNSSKYRIQLGTINGVQNDCQTTVTSLEVLDLDETVCIPIDNVFSVKCLNISTEAIARQEDVDNWQHLRNIQLPKAIINGQVTLLIGVDVPKALEPCEIRKCQVGGGPFAVKTVFGWTLNGPLGRPGIDGKNCFSVNSKSVDDDLQKQLMQYFNQEFSEPLNSERKSMSVNDKKAMKIMEDSLSFVHGHYQMAIPWKDEKPCLPNNRSMAEGRLGHLKKKLSRDSTMRVKYADFIDDLLIKGYARKIPEESVNDVGNISWYLPHHNVVNSKKPEKVRVVFDCSATFNGESLNNNVLQGPDLTNSLVGVLCRFRQENVAIVADIEAMYHQVRVDPNDIDALKFMWFPDGDLSKQPEEYQMLVHLFGGIWSSCCANYALQRTALDNSEKFDADVISTVQKDFYVDDLIKSVKTSEDAIRMRQQLTRMLACGGFHLTKWNSNCRKVLDGVPLGEHSKELSNINIKDDALPVERTLGMEWDIEKDSFRFKINVKEKQATRRGMLSIISSVFDPLRFVAPFILPAKVLLQTSCHKLGWDDEISGECLRRWKNWLMDLPTLESVLVKRCVKPQDFGESVRHEIHHFCDASETGYGTVSYLRSINKNGKINCAFLFAKSRLVPMKRITILRLKLTAATLAVKIDGTLRRELEIPIDNSLFWTDSTCTLRYIKNKDRRFHTFVANRIAVIHDGSDLNQWNYVATKENPADDASRGLSAKDLLLNERWIHGPEFLWTEANTWLPCDENISEMAEDDIEVKRLVQTHSMEISLDGMSMSSRIFSRFSSWFKLKKAVAWLLRFKKWFLYRFKRKEEYNPLLFQKRITVEEMNEAENVIVKCVQSECFAEEISTIQSMAMVKKSSSLRRLDPFLKEGILCVGGRLKNAPYEYNDTKYPIILPKNHHVSDLIIFHFHETSGHFGQEYVLSLIREKFWIIQARVPVRRITKGCFDCKRRTQEPSDQKMADLPADRVTPNNPPFTSVGVDYFGPFIVKRGRTMVKRYGVVFTCLAIRAVHIEIAHSLETDSFINALRRFIARRGTPEILRSDNGTNFKGGERELREAIEQWNLDKLHEFCLQRKVYWLFNPPAASHMGGIWERMIRSIRRILNALLKNQTLDDESLSTLMCEVESILNARPLTKVSDDSRDFNALTPNHLLLLKSNVVLPPGNFERSDQYCKKRWRQIQYMANVFWKRWMREYIPILQARPKWQTVRQNLAKDDIVLVVDKSLPRNCWPLGRILDVHAGRDGLIRSARLKTASGELVRPVEKLCLLEGQDA